MYRDLNTLLELQQTDLRIEELTTQVESLPARIQAAESELAEFLHAHDEREKRLSANQKERRDFEGDVQLLKEKISKHKDQLYEVKTNEQYRAMVHEIEGEETKVREIEDRILEKMIEAEEIQQRVKESGARLASEKKRVADERARLEALHKKDIVEQDALSARRKQLVEQVEEQWRIIYERVRRGRGGVALAEVRGGLCMGCNVMLRPQLYNEVRADEGLHTCENCARILYYLGPAPDPAESGGSLTATESA